MWHSSTIDPEMIFVFFTIFERKFSLFFSDYINRTLIIFFKIVNLFLALWRCFFFCFLIQSAVRRYSISHSSLDIIFFMGCCVKKNLFFDRSEDRINEENVDEEIREIFWIFEECLLRLWSYEIESKLSCVLVICL